MAQRQLVPTPTMGDDASLRLPAPLADSSSKESSLPLATASLLLGPQEAQ